MLPWVVLVRHCVKKLIRGNIKWVWFRVVLIPRGVLAGYVEQNFHKGAIDHQKLNSLRVECCMGGPHGFSANSVILSCHSCLPSLGQYRNRDTWISQSACIQPAIFWWLNLLSCSTTEKGMLQFPATWLVERGHPIRFSIFKTRTTHY